MIRDQILNVEVPLGMWERMSNAWQGRRRLLYHPTRLLIASIRDGGPIPEVITAEQMLDAIAPIGKFGPCHPDIVLRLTKDLLYFSLTRMDVSVWHTWPRDDRLQLARCIREFMINPRRQLDSFLGPIRSCLYRCEVYPLIKETFAI